MSQIPVGWTKAQQFISTFFFRHHHHPILWVMMTICQVPEIMSTVCPFQRSTEVQRCWSSPSQCWETWTKLTDVGMFRGKFPNPSCQGSYVLSAEDAHLWTRAFTMAHLGVLGSCGAATGCYPCAEGFQTHAVHLHSPKRVTSTPAKSWRMSLGLNGVNEMNSAAMM